MSRLELLVRDLAFPEGPRWHDNKLWFSDIHARTVMTVDLHGKLETIVDVPGRPSGLGWLPDGSLLIVSMNDRCLYRWVDGQLLLHADLSGFTEFPINDMCVDSQGRAYVGGFGFDFFNSADFHVADLYRIDLDGSVHIAASGLAMPNGTVITPDGKTLIIAEPYRVKLTAYEIAEDGELSNRSTFARFNGASPDGICLDAEGAVWAASPFGNKVLRVNGQGEVLDTIETEQKAVAVALGGDDGKRLFVASFEEMYEKEALEQRTGRIEVARVDVPGATLSSLS
ncbi:MAG: SMP-30/gluconolactonase/LRE family protein [Polyangiaceae bacterium]|nr:SMP-30/gluconolactonase/LRE family protein [Polyangiaceae bacterium]